MSKSNATLCKEAITDGIGYEQWLRRYAEVVGNVSDSGEARIFCVAHDNQNTAAASFNVITGLWKCQSAHCGAEGDAISFYRHVTRCKNDTEAIRKLAQELGVLKEITDAVIDQLCRTLHQDPARVAIATKMFGLTPATLVHFQIGLHRPEQGTSRLSIPIQDEDGKWADVRLYHRDMKPKVTHWAPGHGAPRFFPITHLQQDTLVLFEGEKDAMRAWEFGIPGALTITGGAGVLPPPPELKRLLQGKKLFICYDVDGAGKDGAAKIARRLAFAAREVFVVSLPTEGLSATGDFSDWVNLGHTPTDWEALIATAERILPPAEGELDLPEGAEPREVSFGDLQSGNLFSELVRFRARPMGQSHGLSSYQVPLKVTADCSRDQKKTCNICPLYRLEPGERPWTLPLNHRSERALQLFRTTEEAQLLALRKVLGVPINCPVVLLQASDRRTVQHLILTEGWDITQAPPSQAGHVTAYYHGGPVSDSRDYWFTGQVQADPKTQQTVLNLHKAEPARSELDHFIVDDEVFEAIEWFRPRQGVTTEQHLRDLRRIVEEDAGIYGQPDAVQALFDATFSVERFRVGGTRIDYGLNEVLILGETGSGKTTLARRWGEMISLGEYVNCETASFAGLVGGVETIDKVRVVKWGALVRNDRGIVWADEMDALVRMGNEILSSMTAIRSTGVAEINKIEGARAPCRVRIVWISNPKGGREIRSYNGACRAIEELIPNRQDISRITKAVVVTSHGVDLGDLTANRAQVQRPGVRGHFNKLALLAWKLSEEEVRFTDEAILLLQSETSRLLLKYHESIPLLDRGRALPKLAKLSIPVAILCGAFQDVGGAMTLVVDRTHVEEAIRHLEEVYDSADMGFDRYSAAQRAMDTIPDEAAVRQALRSSAGVEHRAVLMHFLTDTRLSRTGLEELLGNRISAHEMWSRLKVNHCLQRTERPDQFTKSRAFSELVERLLVEEEQGARLIGPAPAPPRKRVG